MKITSIGLLFTTACFLLAGCKKEDNTISPVPEIEVVSVSPATVTEFKDSIVFVISYKDGDGDLGQNESGIQNLFITDTRNGVVFGSRIQQLAPDGSDIAIQGKVQVTLNSTTITDQSSSQSVVYEVYVVDRAGNKSNVAIAPAITVVR